MALLRDDFMVASGPSDAELLRLISRAVKRHGLDLIGLRVLTEAGAGLRCVAPVIAALAGGEVYAITRESADSARQDAERDTMRLATAALVSDRVHLLSSRLQAPAAGIDIVTNLPGVQPIDETAMRTLNGTGVVTLMGSARRWRVRDVDVAACRRLSVAVAGVDEDALDLHRFEPMAALYGLLASGISANDATVLVAGDGPAFAHIAKGLAGVGARVFAAAHESAGRLALYDAMKVGDGLGDETVHELLAELDAIVLCPDRDDARIIGPGCGLDGSELAARAPHVVLISLGGELDRRALAAEGVRAWPPSGSACARDLLPKPLIELHTAGLKVGEALTRARQRGSSPLAAEQAAADGAYADLLPKDLSALKR